MHFFTSYIKVLCHLSVLCVCSGTEIITVTVTFKLKCVYPSLNQMNSVFFISGNGFFTIENADPDENAPLDMYLHCLHWPLLLIWHSKLLFIESTENSCTCTYSICILYVPIISLVNCSFHSFAFGNQIL